jgi:hypothetical protein
LCHHRRAESLLVPQLKNFHIFNRLSVDTKESDAGAGVCRLGNIFLRANKLWEFFSWFGFDVADHEILIKRRSN